MEVTRILGPHTVNLHIKDFRIQRLDHQMGFTVSGCPAGKGQVPLPCLLDFLQQTGKCQSASLEIWSPLMIHIQDSIKLEAAWGSESIRRLQEMTAYRDFD